MGDTCGDWSLQQITMKEYRRLKKDNRITQVAEPVSVKVRLSLSGAVETTYQSLKKYQTADSYMVGKPETKLEPPNMLYQIFPVVFYKTR